MGFLNHDDDDGEGVWEVHVIVAWVRFLRCRGLKCGVVEFDSHGFKGG